MNDVTERMADAMYAAATAGGNAPFPWENAYLPNREVFVRAALAGLAAIREPTPAMVAAGNAAQTETHGPDMGSQVAMESAVPWRAMVDAARGEPPCP